MAGVLVKPFTLFGAWYLRQAKEHPFQTGEGSFAATFSVKNALYLGQEHH